MAELPPSPYTGNGASSHPCCRWDQRLLGKGPLTDLNQLIRITNYSDTHARGRGCGHKDRAAGTPARIPLFHSSHFFMQCVHSSGVISFSHLGRGGRMSTNDIGGGPSEHGEMIFYCSPKRMKAFTETHQPAWMEISSHEIRFK